MLKLKNRDAFIEKLDQETVNWAWSLEGVNRGNTLAWKRIREEDAKWQAGDLMLERIMFTCEGWDLYTATTTIDSNTYELRLGCKFVEEVLAQDKKTCLQAPIEQYFLVVTSIATREVVDKFHLSVDDKDKKSEDFVVPPLAGLACEVVITCAGVKQKENSRTAAASLVLDC